MAIPTFKGINTPARSVVPLKVKPNQLVTKLLCNKQLGSVRGASQCQLLVNASSIRRFANQQLCARATSAAAAEATAAVVPEGSEIGIYDVEELSGIRANLDSQDPVVEYRVRWKDGSPDTWELASNVSPDLVRDFDERWWQAAKKGDVEAITSMLKHSRVILSQVVDENRRSALHFVAAIGNIKCVKLLVDAGAELDLQDKEGYTPLHMACGYMQTGAMTALLEAGADPLIKDKQGRDVVTLVENLRKSLAPNMAVLQRIMALEQVASGLTDRLYEEVEPAHILDERAAADGNGRELLIQFQDDVPDEWLPEALVAPDLIEDWSAGLERAPVKALLDVQQWGTSREYLMQWADGAQDSWEPEEHVPPELVEELQQQQPELFKGLKGLGKKKKKTARSAKQQKKQQPASSSSSAGSNGSVASHSSNDGASSSSGGIGSSRHDAAHSGSSSSSGGSEGTLPGTSVINGDGGEPHAVGAAGAAPTSRQRRATVTAG